jgi:hypothetical protein
MIPEKTKITATSFSEGSSFNVQILFEQALGL